MKKQILLIEDDKFIRENTAEILQFANYDVITASDGKKGIKKAFKNMPDIIVCDILMPKLNGYAVFKTIYNNSRFKNTPFIFLSAKTTSSDRRKGMALGVDDYITKPFSESELIYAIETRLRKANLQNDFLLDNITTKALSFPKVSNIDALIEILCDKPTHSYKKGESLYCEGNRSNYLFLVKEGIIKTFKSNNDGKELITGLFKKRDFIGYTSSLGDFPYSENAVSLGDAKLIKIDKLEIKEILKSNPHITLEILSWLSNNIETIKNNMLHIAYNTVRTRVAKTLLLVIKDDPLKKIHISRTDLAKLTGIAKETLIRTLAHFRTEGLLETSRICITIIDKIGLKKAH